MKRIQIVALALMATVLGTGLLAAEPARRGDQGDRKRIERPQTETPEMKAQRHKRHEFRVEMLNLMVKHGKIEKARAEFMIKKMNNEKAFKDANPEWVKYQRRHPGMKHGKPGKKGCPGMDRRPGDRRGMHEGRPGMDRRPMPRGPMMDDCDDCGDDQP